MTDFDAALQSHLVGCQKIINDVFANNYPNCSVPRLEARHGRRYVKIVQEGASAFSFIDAKSGPSCGDVLMAASWSAPAKGARGNIFDEHNGLKRMQWTGPAYNR